jgi:hypothetical protein
VKIKRMKAKPVMDEAPKPNGIPTIDEKMINRLHRSFAKWEILTIRPTSLFQPFICPKPILESNPNEELDLRRSPNPPTEEMGGDTVAPKN